MSNNKNNNRRIIILKQSKDLETSKLVKIAIYNIDTGIIDISLNGSTNSSIVFTLDYKKWTNNPKMMIQQAEELGIIDKQLQLLLKRLLNENAERILNTKQQRGQQERGQESQQEQQQQEPISFTEWSTKLTEKYSNLQKEILNLIPELWEPVEFALSIKAILKIHRITLPFAGIILGPPSSLKTATIELFRDTKDAYYTDNFSPKAWVTHNTAIPKDKLHEIDLLPKIKDKLFLTPELSPTFSKKEEELNEILGIWTRILDGNGYESDSGAQGHRGYNGEYMFVWIGAAVDIPRKVYKLLATLGPKLYFFRIKTVDKPEEYFLQQLQKESIDGDFRTKIDKIKTKLYKYLDYFDIKVKTDNENDDDNEDDNKNKNKEAQIKNHPDSEKVLLYIIRLAHLLRRLRGNVPVWDPKDSQGSDYGYTFPTLEDPNRAITQLRNLARGHALSQGRDYISLVDIPLLIKLVLSTASRERVIVFDHLLENDGLLDSTNIAEHLKVSKNTALKTMTELIVLGIGNRIALDNNNNNAFQIQLNPEFEWFLSPEFKKLREDFGKEYYNEYLAAKQAQREKREEEEDSENE